MLTAPRRRRTPSTGLLSTRAGGRHTQRSLCSFLLLWRRRIIIITARDRVVAADVGEGPTARGRQRRDEPVDVLHGRLGVVSSDACCVAMGAAPGEHWRGSRGGCGSDVYGCRITKRCDFYYTARLQLGRGFPCLAVQRQKILMRVRRSYCNSARINCASMLIFLPH